MISTADFATREQLVPTTGFQCNDHYRMVVRTIVMLNVYLCSFTEYMVRAAQRVLKERFIQSDLPVQRIDVDGFEPDGNVDGSTSDNGHVAAAKAVKVKCTRKYRKKSRYMHGDGADDCRYASEKGRGGRTGFFFHTAADGNGHRRRRLQLNRSLTSSSVVYARGDESDRRRHTTCVGRARRANTRVRKIFPVTVLRRATRSQRRPRRDERTWCNAAVRT